MHVLKIETRKLTWAGHVARMEAYKSAFKILKGTHPGRRSIGRPRRRWEDNIRLDLKRIGINTRNWVDSTQGKDYWRSF